MEKTSRRPRVSDAPEGTRSFAIVMEDPGSSRGAFTHWLLHDTPATTTVLWEQSSAKALCISFVRHAARKLASADIEIQQDDHDHIDWKIADAGGREAPLARCNDSLLIQSRVE